MASNQLNGTAEHLSLVLLDATELLTHALLACPISAINFLLILRTSILHPNLKFVLLCQSTSIFTRSIGRLLINAFQVFTGNVFWDKSPLLDFLFGFSAFFRNFLAHVLVAERAMATLFVKYYEHHRSPLFSLLWFTAIALLSLANSLNLVSSVGIQMFTWSFVFLLSLSEVLIFAWIWRHNDRNFQERLFARQHSLSERYQLAENIRTGRQLVPTLFIHFFNIGLGTLVNWCNYAHVFGPAKAHLFHYALMDQLFYCAIAATNFLIELTMIWCHPYLRRNLVALLSGLKSKICPARLRPSVSPNNSSTAFLQEILRMNIRGQRADLAGFGGGYETEEYFEQLKKTWEICDSKRK